MNVLDLVNKFNNGDLNVEKFFNDYETFFDVLRKRDALHLIDPQGSDSEDWQNEFLIWLSGNNPEIFKKYVVKILNDDLEIDENGKIFFVTNDRGSLSRLFCDGRNTMSQDTIEQILSGEGDVWEPYWDTTDDVYRDVIEELTPENDRRLQEYIVDSLKDTKIEPESEELELIANEQGHPEYAIVNSENVKRIIDDKETMEILFDHELSELKSELFSVHSSAYNSAYENEVWESIWDKINEYFNGSGEWISRPHAYKKDTNVQIFRIPVSQNFSDIILDYLDHGKNWGNSGTLEYQGSYLNVLTETVDCLNVYPPDYPDSSEVDKNINLYFRDYI